MSDNSYLCIEFKKIDFQKTTEALESMMWEGSWWDEVEKEGELTITVKLYEANYDGSTITDALIAENIPFDACYGPGGSYGPGALVHFEGEEAEVSTDMEGSPMVIYERDGISEKDEEHVKKYYSLLEKVEKYFKDEGS